MAEFKDPKFIMLIAVGLVFTVVGGWKYMDFKAQKEYTVPTSTKNMPVITPPTSSPPGNTPDAIEDSKTYTISMNSDGFSPANLTINKGDTVHFVNNDTKDHWPASDVHPVHAIYPEFDSRAVVAPGQEWSFKFERVGEWGMHDHRNPIITGKIIVK